MKIAVSFLSVVAIVVAVGAAAVYILWITRDCKSGQFRCEDGACIPFSQLCDHKWDCANGSDEIPHECADLTTLDEQLWHFIPTHTPPSRVPANISCQILPIPDDCECSRGYGAVCVNVTWPRIPWGKFHRNTTRLVLRNALGKQASSYGWEEATATLTELKVLVFWDQPYAPDFPWDLISANEDLLHLHIENCSVRSIPWGIFKNMKKIRKLNILHNAVEELELNTFSNLPDLEFIDLSSNRLHLTGFSFHGLPALYDLSLKDNRIESIGRDFLGDLTFLKFLDLRSNRIRYIHAEAFRSSSSSLRMLTLSDNRIASLDPHTFQGMSLLKRLHMGNNPMKRLSSEIFCSLSSVESLNLTGIEIENIDLDIFSCMRNLTFVHFKKFQFCRFVPKVPKCYPSSNGLSSTRDLLVGRTLRLIIWVIAMLTVFGNITVLVTRWLSSRKSSISDVFINNLAAADILTGVYLITLALKDIELRGSYNLHAYEWSTSWQCSAIGVLAMISCEVSLLILTIMSLERYLVISGPFAAPKLGKTLAFASMGIIWVFVVGLAITPLIQWRGKASFYGSSGLCFPLHLDEPFATGWEYSAFVFIGLNSLCLMLIASCYGKLFWVIRKTRLSTPIMVRDMEMALRFFLMVVSDFCCWAPVIILKVIVLYGFEIRQDVHAWLLIFVIPLNSAVNPFLYTFSTGSVRTQFLQQLFASVGRINQHHRDEIHVLRNVGTMSDTPLYNSVLSK